MALAHCGPSARRQRVHWLILAGSLGLGACGADATVVTPVIDLPTDDTDATASPLDEITVTVAHAKSDRDLVSQTFARGVALEVPGVPFGDDLVVHMSGFVGASNIAYGRTCAIVVSPSAAPPTPHLFFSRSVKFASLDLAPTPRTGGLGIPYLGAALLVAGNTGGLGCSDMVTVAERFDPLTGQLTTISGVAPRDQAVQALIGASPPRVAVIGGASCAPGASSPSGAGFIEILDGRRVDRFEFSQVARVDLTATSLADGRVIVIGGSPPGQPPLGEIDQITLDGAAPDVRKVATLAHPRSGHSATSLGDDFGAPVLIAGGVDGAGLPIDVAELFKPLSSGLANPMTFAPKMKFPRHRHTASLMPDGSVLFIGGLDALGQPVSKLELFSVDAGFVEVGELPMEAGTVDFATTPLPDGRILITGGRAMPDSSPLNTAYIASLNPLDGSVDVVATDHMAIARAGHQAVLLCDGTILITGGTPGQFPAERYNPPPLGRR